ncbi:SDR family NAD(P)-dependent oxidoreductase [Streptomyces sp. NPDC088350]|uniref:SDR family NAD(P)-dependent oxidoreductase n=1 Tax=Streptomyces sp. NPDC088350 TaxID=3365854 RepID=UPI00382DC29D
MSQRGGRQVAVVTGAESGAGHLAAWSLARRGADVLLCSRDADAADALGRRLRREPGAGEVTALAVDPVAPESVHRVASYAADLGAGRVDRLVLHTADDASRAPGQVPCYPGLFALTGALYPLLLRSQDSVVLSVCHPAHRLARTGKSARPGDSGRPVGRADDELLKVLFAAELDRRVRLAGHRVSVVAAYVPGALDVLWSRGRGRWGSRGTLPALERSSAVTRALLAPDLVGGTLYGSRWVPRERVPRPITRGLHRESLARASAMWSDAEALTGLRFLT